MTKPLLAVHVLAAIITIGPVTVAAGMFPPAVRRALTSLDGPAELLEPTAVQRTAGQLGMFTGVFNLLWATVTVLMIIRPGSTTGARH
ncbi:hypothetical protein OG311_02240 [Streptomyces sp. NBC_01343]|uniref:hypothetical protein n=1 Tax=Streptomyces sp. NBC_01343 TaxID=2903832 RepID=UPI002E134574|nr:hypothetical protein OG311_02240 [Streptomyces sp. NBC_01343]